MKASGKAVTAALREAGTRLKDFWRTQITGAGLGRRLFNSIRNQTIPQSGESLGAAALVWSNAPVIVGAHHIGPLIRSKDGFYFAIPTEAAGRGLRSLRTTRGNGSGGAVYACVSSIADVVRVCWWRRDG